MIRPDDVRLEAQRALSALIGWLGGQDGGSFDALSKAYSELKAAGGRQAVGSRLALNDAELSQLDVAIRDAVRRHESARADAPEIERRNAVIAALRLIGWTESIALRIDGFDYRADLSDESADMGLRQVRALELIIRSLVTERYESQPKLLARLKALLGERPVQDWLKNADKGDILSGSTFSDLASLFVSTEEYPGYAPFYDATPLLTLFREKRITIRNFLDDVRRVRNMLVHNKRVTPAQIELLGLYYEELVEPLQQAHDEGRTRVNPDTFLEATREDLGAFIAGLKDDVGTVRDDIAELRADLTLRLTGIAEDTAAIRGGTARIETGVTRTGRRLALVMAGLVLLLLVGAAALYFTVFTAKQTGGIADSTARTEASQARTEETVGDIARDIASLANSGGLVADPQTPAEHFHNARLLHQRGEIDRALEEYKAVLAFKLDLVDPVLDVVELAQGKYGEAGIAAFVETELRPLLSDDLYWVAEAASHTDFNPAFLAKVEDGSMTYTPALAVWFNQSDRALVTYSESQVVQKVVVRVADDFASGAFARHFLDPVRAAAVAKWAVQEAKDNPGNDILQKNNRSPIQADIERPYIHCHKPKTNDWDTKWLLAFGIRSVEDKIDVAKPVEVCGSATPGSPPVCFDLLKAHFISNMLDCETNAFPSVAFSPTDFPTPDYMLSLPASAGMTESIGLQCMVSLSYTDIHGRSVRLEKFYVEHDRFLKRFRRQVGDEAYENIREKCTGHIIAIDKPEDSDPDADTP